MRVLLQRVKEAKVDINNQTVGAISEGLLALVGYAPEDTVETVKKAIDRLIDYRIFPDEHKPINASLRDVKGGLLLVSQFTLMADTRKGLRPGFTTAAAPALAQALYDETVQYAKKIYPTVETGEFGADMQVHLINDGPVTIMLEFQ